MNPFTDVQPGRSTGGRFLVRPALIVFVVCLVGGMALVAWRAAIRSNMARALGRAEAQACGAALEAQLNQAVSAVEVLGTLARQGRGGLTNFQKLAAEVMARHPGLSSLELQPGGVVADIAPRAGNERALGVNVLRDPSQSAGANEAIARRTLTVSGPVRLYRGEQGIVARVPVFVRAPDGRESCWGFVAASMRFQEALAWTQVDRLPRRGYGFALFVPATSRQKGVSIAFDALSSLRGVEQQPVRVENLELCLAIKPRAGWGNKTALVCESVVVLLLAGLGAFLVSVRMSAKALSAELSHATERLAQEQAKRSEAEAARTEATEQLAAAQAELEHAQLGFKQATTRVAELETQLEASAREREESSQQQAARQQEVQTALAKAEETIAQLQARLESSAQAEQAAVAATEERLQQSQAALAEVEAKLEAALCSAQEEAKTKAAVLAQLEQENRDLMACLSEAQQAEARAEALEVLLREAEEALRQRPALAPEAEEIADVEAAPPGEATGATAPSPGTSTTDDVRPEPVLAQAETLQTESAEEDLAATPEPTAPASPAEGPEPELDSALAAALQAEAVAAPVAPQSPAAPEPAAEQAIAPKPAAKPARRKKASRDDQMDLFGAATPEVQASSKPSAKAAERTVEVKESHDAEKAPASHRLPPAPPVDVAQLRKAVHQIVPLLADQDPGAADCLQDNLTTFRSAFPPEAYVEFEQLVQGDEFGPALESLKKAARKHGVAV